GIEMRGEGGELVGELAEIGRTGLRCRECGEGHEKPPSLHSITRILGRLRRRSTANRDARMIFVSSRPACAAASRLDPQAATDSASATSAGGAPEVVSSGKSARVALTPSGIAHVSERDRR